MYTAFPANNAIAAAAAAPATVKTLTTAGSVMAAQGIITTAPGGIHHPHQGATPAGHPKPGAAVSFGPPTTIRTVSATT